MPLAPKPATAPARPGLDGAPSPSAASRQASGPIESKGISVRQKRALWPTRRGIHWLSGRTKSSTTAAQASSAGAIASARPLWARLPPGRPTLSVTQIAVTASETVKTNLDREPIAPPRFGNARRKADSYEEQDRRDDDPASDGPRQDRPETPRGRIP